MQQAALKLWATDMAGNYAKAQATVFERQGQWLGCIGTVAGLIASRHRREIERQPSAGVRLFLWRSLTDVVVCPPADGTGRRSSSPVKIGNPTLESPMSQRFTGHFWAALVAMLMLTACGKQDKPGSSGPGGGRGNQPVPVVVSTIALQDWNDNLQALGTVRAHEAVTVTAKVSETVQQVHFESGQDVAKGAPLVTLSGQQQDALLASAQAQLKDAEAQLQRLTQLGGQQLVARSAVDTARATRDAARAQVRQVAPI